MISVIITTCKREFTLLRRAIDSVLAQTYRDWELIIVDDTPAENPLRGQISQAVATTYSLPNVRYVQNEENRGACYSRNRGLAMAAGEYIAYLDDDDEWLPEKIEKQVSRIEESDEIALVYCGQKVCVQETGQVQVSPIEVYEGKVFSRLILSNFIGSTSIPLLRKSALLDIGGG